MDRKEICLIVKVIAAGMLAACQTMAFASTSNPSAIRLSFARILVLAIVVSG
jgi:hypothetical protein